MPVTWTWGVPTPHLMTKVKKQHLPRAKLAKALEKTTSERAQNQLEVNFRGGFCLPLRLFSASCVLCSLLVIVIRTMRFSQE